MASNITVRRATLADYLGVMEIGNIFYGRDYLPVMYDKYLKCFKGRVAEKNGEIVGFNVERLVDGGMTLFTAAARVKENYQNQGILAAILKDVYEFYQDKESVKYEAMLTDNVNMEISGDKIKRRFTQIIERVYLEITGKVADFKPNINDFDETNVRELTSEDLKEIFQSKDTCSRLFPEERILPIRYPYRLLPENIPLMMDGLQFWGTKSSDQSTYKTLTVTEHFNLEERLILKLCIYGNDAVDIQQHCLKHIHNLNLFVNMGTCTSIMIHISHFLDCQDTGTFLSVFEKCGLKINDDFPVTRMFLFERMMRSN